MIDFKKLHGDFLMHQALLTAVAANNPIQQASPMSSSLSTEGNNERKQQIENSCFNDTSYDCPSSMSSLCSNSPNDLSPSSVIVDDKSYKDRENSSNDRIYQVIAKKQKTEHHNENSSHQRNEKLNHQTSQMNKKDEDNSATEQHPVEDSTASPLSITVHSTPSSRINFSPIGSSSNGSNNNKRKFSDYESSIINDNLNDSNINEQKIESDLNYRIDFNKISRSNSVSSKQKGQNASSLSSLSSSSPNSINSSTCSPLSSTQSISYSKTNNNNLKPSFMISDILGLENNSISTLSSDQLSSNITSPISNEQLFQQCQIQLQRAFPYLSNLTNNQSDLFRLIASTLAMENQNKYLNTLNTTHTSLTSDISNSIFSKNNQTAASSTPILTSPKINEHNYSNINSNNANSSSPCETKTVNIHNPIQTNINNMEKKAPTAPTANLILSSLEQLTYNQFKDYSSSTRKTVIDSNSNLSFSKKLSSCTPNNSASQLSPLSSLSSLSSSSSSASSLSSLSSSLISSKNPNKTAENRSSSSEQINRKNMSKNEVLETSSATNINKSTNDQNGNLWPAWVYCTRYSDRPSAGKYKFYINISFDLKNQRFG